MVFQTPTAKSLEGKAAIVTGGSSSIGRAICFAYAQHGAKVLVADIRDSSRDPTETVPTHEFINKEGGVAAFKFVDVTNEDSVKEVIAEAVKLFGRLDIMVNNAGICIEASSKDPMPFWDMPVSAFDKSVEVNGRGMWLGTKYALAQMIKQDPFPGQSGPTPSRGWIVNMASIFSLVGASGTAAYSVSKTLSTGITRAAALDAAPMNIHVNAICPGFIDTTLTSEQWARIPEAKKYAESQHPFNGGRFGAPEEVAPLAVFLAGEGARWITGAAYTVDGGFTAQ